MNNIREYLGQVTWLGPEKATFKHPHYRIDFYGACHKAPCLESFHHTSQVHGVSVALASEDTSFFSSNRPEADGLWVQEKNTPIVVKTADCLPVLLVHKNGLVGIVLHAGWRSLFSGILTEGVAKYKVLGYAMEDLMVFVGPALSREAFEVGPEVVKFLEQGPLNLSELELSTVLMKGVEDKWHIDLATSAVLYFRNQGVLAQNITVVRSCTKSNPSLWHSFRREKIPAKVFGEKQNLSVLELL